MLFVFDHSQILIEEYERCIKYMLLFLVVFLVLPTDKLPLGEVSEYADDCAVLPEGHGEPHGHHHVGGAAVLGRENGLEVIPHLK